MSPISEDHSPPLQRTTGRVADHRCQTPGANSEAAALLTASVQCGLRTHGIRNLGPGGQEWSALTGQRTGVSQWLEGIRQHLQGDQRM